MANTPAAAPDPKTKKIVVYTGTSHIREIDAKSFEQVGVQGQKKAVWDQATGKELPFEDFNADAIRFLTERSGGEFEVREVPA